MKKILTIAFTGVIFFASINSANADEAVQKEEFTISPTTLRWVPQTNVGFVNTITTSNLGSGPNPEQPPSATRTVLDLPAQFKINNTAFPYCDVQEIQLQNTTTVQAKDLCGSGSIVSDDAGTSGRIIVDLPGADTKLDVPLDLTMFNEEGSKLLIHMRADSVNNTSVFVGKLMDSTAGSAYGKALDITIPPLLAGAISLFKLTIPESGYIQASCNPTTLKAQATTTFENAPTTTDDHSVSAVCVGPDTDAFVKAIPDVVSVGEKVTFDASESYGDGLTFRWDLDGDGSFERDTGKTAVTTKSYDDRGVQKVGVRTKNSNGKVSEAFAFVTVGPLGVSIEDGATYTNDPKVSIRAVYPPDAKDATISNDGGFGEAETIAARPFLDWKLASSGPERLPKTVYVRFSGGSEGDTTYTDDIILDETAPVIKSASVSGSARLSPRATSPRGQRTLRIKAKDQTSGVEKMQITSNKKKPDGWREFKRASRFNGAAKKVFVRVRDRAGNASGWKRAIR